MPTTPSQLLVLIAALLWHATNAKPFVVLNENNSVQCTTVPYPANSKLVVSYEFLDFRMSLDNVEIVIRPTAYDDDDDSYMDDEYDDDDDDEPDDDHAKQAANTQNYKVPKKSGTIDFHIKHHGPRVQVCVYGNKQGREKMSRTLFVSLTVTMEVTFDGNFENSFNDDYMNTLMAEKDEIDMIKEENLINKEAEKRDQKQGHAHLSSMEKSIASMVRDVDYIQNYAKAQKTLEGKFFNKSKELNSSIKIWPALHVLVLMVTGFAQARHMIKFFKSRRVM